MYSLYTQAPLGNTVLMEHDERSNRVLMIDAEGNRTEHGYNQEGQMISESRRADANFVQVSQMAYNAQSLLDTMTLPDGNIIYHHYDREGKLLGKSLNARTAPFRQFIEYDVFDRVVREGNDQATFTYAYDLLGRFASSTQRMATLDRNFTITLSYDIQSRLIGFTDHDGLSTQYRYDAMNRLVAMGTPAGEHRFGYDARGVRTTTTFPNGHETVNVVDEGARLLSVATTTKLGDPVATYAYELDSMGMRTAVDEVLAYPGSDTATRRHEYQYDDLYRLTRVDYDASFNRPAETYTYDDAHNRATLTREGVGTITYQYDELDRLLSTTGLENRSYEYTPNGQLAIETNNGNTTTYDWDIFGRLRERSLNGIPQGTYEYATNGYRTFMDEGEATHFVLNGPNVLADVIGGATERRYVHGMGMDELYAVTNSNGDSQYYHRDGLGSVVAVSNSTASTVSSQSYSAWGERIGPLTTGLNDTIGSRFGYTSREHGAGGLSYYRARHYHPSLGRFISRDTFQGTSSIPTSLQRYSYVQNDPIRRVDPTGHFSLVSMLNANSIQNTLRSRQGLMLRNIYIRAEQLLDILDWISFLGDIIDVAVMIYNTVTNAPNPVGGAQMAASGMRGRTRILDLTRLNLGRFRATQQKAKYMLRNSGRDTLNRLTRGNPDSPDIINEIFNRNPRTPGIRDRVCDEIFEALEWSLVSNNFPAAAVFGAMFISHCLPSGNTETPPFIDFP